MSSETLWGWDTPNTEWVKVIVDSLGHLQVDVITAGSTASNCKGWTGAIWTPLLVESLANANLRVKLYDGANGIDSLLWSENAVTRANKRGLDTASLIYLAYAVNAMGIWKAASYLGDTETGAYIGSVALWGYNGAFFDRLRSYGTGVLTVAKGAIAPTRIRMTATGRVGVAGAKKLFWIACSPDGPSAEWEIGDNDTGGGAIVYDHFDTDKHSDHIDFNPPMEFATGIWVEKFDHMKSLVFCYQ